MGLLCLLMGLWQLLKGLFPGKKILGLLGYYLSKMLPHASFLEHLVMMESMPSQLRFFAATLRRGKKLSERWILDSGAEFHVACSLASVEDLEPQETPNYFFLENGEPLPTLGRGSIATERLKIPNVYYVPGASCNIISVSQLFRDHELSSTFHHDRCYVRDRSSNIVAFGVFYEDKFVLDHLRIEQNHASLATGNQDAGGWTTLYGAIWEAFQTYFVTVLGRGRLWGCCEASPELWRNMRSISDITGTSVLIDCCLEYSSFEDSSFDDDCQMHIDAGNEIVVSADIAPHPYNRSLFFMDSGAGFHITPHKHLLQAYLEYDNPMFPNYLRRQVVCADGKILAVHGMGNIDTRAIMLEDVLYVPGMVANLVSVKFLIHQINQQLQGRGEAAVTFFGSRFIVHIFGGAMQNHLLLGDGGTEPGSKDIFVLNALKPLRMHGGIAWVDFD